MYKALTMVNSVTENLCKIRRDIDAFFPSWYDEILKLADTIGATESVPRKTNLQKNRSNTPSSSPQEHYKRVIALPLLDSLITQLKERFDGENKRRIQALLSLVPSVMLSMDAEFSDQDFMFWKEDLPTPKSLAGELRRWKRLWSDDNSQSEPVPSNLLQALTLCDAESYQNIHHLLMIGCTLPITSAEAERTFSLLRRIKTYTRSTLLEEHFSDLAIIAMHYKERIPTEEVLKAFIQHHPRRIFLKSVLED